MKDHGRCCGHEHASGAAVPRRKAGEPVIAPTGPVSSTIAAYATRVRPWISEDVVERRARELHAGASYDCWNGLSDSDQELWRHMARLDLTRW